MQRDQPHQPPAALTSHGNGLYSWTVPQNKPFLPQVDIVKEYFITATEKLTPQMQIKPIQKVEEMI